jgi:hypothetical protein
MCGVTKMQPCDSSCAFFALRKSSSSPSVTFLSLFAASFFESIERDFIISRKVRKRELQLSHAIRLISPSVFVSLNASLMLLIAILRLFELRR